MLFVRWLVLYFVLVFGLFWNSFIYFIVLFVYVILSRNIGFLKISYSFVVKILIDSKEGLYCRFYSF